MTKMYHMPMLVSSEDDAPPLSPTFTREQCSQDHALKPLAMRQRLNTLDCLESRLPNHHATMYGAASLLDHSSTRPSAFSQKLPANTQVPSPKYYLPMKPCSREDGKPQLSMKRYHAPCHPSTSDTMLSSFESVHSTPLSCHNFDDSPPNLNYQSLNYIVEMEKSIPLNILLPSL